MEAPTARSSCARSADATRVRTRETSPDTDLLALHARRPQRYPFLLESAARGTAQGRFDILLAFPRSTLSLEADGSLRGVRAGRPEADFLAALDSWWASLRTDREDGWLPFRGGWFLLLGYELASQVEPTLGLTASPGLPVALAVRIPAAIVHDHARGRRWLVAEPDEAVLLDALEADLRACPPVSASSEPLASGLVEEAPERYLEAVRRAQRHIGAGDIFQANLSREWRARWPADGQAIAALYDRLRRGNPGPFAGLARWRELAVISSSPERLLRIRDRVAETRPIAGTRPRGRGGADDLALSRELAAHPKERAEHVMLIDLERNDLGRVCSAGSVEVDELMVIESYAHVHHIVSNVRGVLAPDVTPGEAIRAVFPGGTITGCPKVRCMEIIDALEGAPRGPYTGSMGYLNRDGSCDLNILIRTIVVHRDMLSFRAGAGIVADSDPERELAETRDKARGMVLAIAGGDSA